MVYLNPETVGRAARRLFGSGHSESLVFFFLKAEGAATDKWITVTSSETPPPGLQTIALQPDGFDKVVEANLGSFSDPNDQGWPTTPGTRGSPRNYTMFFPITEETQYILRKHDCNRNAVWSNITGGRNALNTERASADEVFEIRDPSVGHGKELRFRDQYVYAAHWYYGPKKGVPLRVPLKALAIWMHRPPKRLSDDVTMGWLVEETIKLLNITSEELLIIFDEEEDFPLSPDDLVSTFDLETYFRALCVPHGKVSVVPHVVADKYLTRDRETWEFIVTALDLKRGDQLCPNETADQLIAAGQKNILFYGPPRTGKSTAAAAVAARYLGISADSLHADARFTRMQFHQSWSYGDFIRKLIPAPASTAITFKRQKGLFLRHCERYSEGKSVVLIDEINRANLANVFGEAFQVMEVGYRGMPIALPGSLEEETAGESTLTIPQGLLLLATANDLDRSTQALDFALLARFATVPMLPNYGEVYSTLRGKPGWTDVKAEAFVLLLREVEGISGYPIGHAYFYDFGKPDSVALWYQTLLRPTIGLYLTNFRLEDLKKIDRVFGDWTP